MIAKSVVVEACMKVCDP